MHVVALEAARALVELADHIEKRWPDAQKCDRYQAPTGETFTEISQTGFESPAACAKAARDAFDAYAEGKSGTLYYRSRPEMTTQPNKLFQPNKLWAFYMRLLISDKPIVAAGV
jgi:hypothetical protein